MPLSHDHIRTTVETYLARHPHEREQLGGLLDALDRPTDIASRPTFTGHVTCGAIVVDPLGRVLHVLHLASGKVLAPGGHTEPADESLAAAALRELHEETGIPPQAVTPWPGYEAEPDWGRGSVPSLQYSGTRRRSQSLTLEPFRGAQRGNLERSGPYKTDEDLAPTARITPDCR